MKRKLYSLLLVIILVCSYNLNAYGSNNQSDLNYELTEIVKDNESYLIEDYKRFEELDNNNVAVALTGGGATGFFNIGVLKALLEEDIPVDIIVGSSMGAIVATMYGSGLNIEQVEDIVIKVPFMQMFDFNIGNRESILKTAKVNKFIEEISPQKDLADFPVPTALLSIDLNEGKKYLTTTGKISEVMQGSYSIPLYFPIHNYRGRYFADPGVVENSPAKAAKVLGADFVIATAIGGEVNDEDEKYNTPTKAVSRYIEVVQNLTSNKVVEEYADIIIKPDLSNYGFMDYDSADKLIEVGYKYTKDLIPEIKEELKTRDISLKKETKKEYINLSSEYRDLKYDRFLIRKTDFKPTIYYGKDYSFFRDKLGKNNVDSILYGIEFTKNQLDLNFLKNNYKNENYLHLRLKKLTQDFDLISKYRIKDDYIDYQTGLKYLDNDYTIESGIGKVNDKNYLFLKSDFELELYDYLFDTENAIYYKNNSKKLGLLTSLNTKSRLNKIWDIELGLVYNNTNLINSPIFYRGGEINKKNNFQLSLDYLYTHKFIDNIDFLGIFEMEDISAYFFTDYLNDKSNIKEDFAYGVGSKSNFYLLGLKPFDLEIYYSFEEKSENNNLGIRFDYNF